MRENHLILFFVCARVAHFHVIILANKTVILDFQFLVIGSHLQHITQLQYIALALGICIALAICIGIDLVICIGIGIGIAFATGIGIV